VTQHQDLSFALARVISCDPEQSAEDEVTEGEEHRRMILSPWPLGGTMVSDPFRSTPTPKANRIGAAQTAQGVGASLWRDAWIAMSYDEVGQTST
jgi:hypothetical protein